MTTDAKIQDVAVRDIRRAVGDRALLPFESLGTLHPALTEHFSLQDEELVLLSAFFSSKSWSVFTTRRIASLFGEELRSLDPTQGVEAVFPNYKGYAPRFPSDPPDDESEIPELPAAGVIPRDIATIRARNSRVLIHFEYETGQACQPPMAAVGYWEGKHPFLDRLMTNAELEHYKRNIAVPRERRGLPDIPAKEQAQYMVKLHSKGFAPTDYFLDALLHRASPETLPVFMSEFTPKIHDYLRQVALPKYGALLEAIRDWYGSNAG